MTTAAHSAARFHRPRFPILPGLLLAAGVAIVATVIGKAVPVVGTAVPGAVIGAVIAITRRPGTVFTPGLKWASSFVLQCSVVILGTQLSIGRAGREPGHAALRRAGAKPMLLGLLLWITVAAASLGLPALTGTLS